MTAMISAFVFVEFGFKPAADLARYPRRYDHENLAVVARADADAEPSGFVEDECGALASGGVHGSTSESASSVPANSFATFSMWSRHCASGVASKSCLTPLLSVALSGVAMSASAAATWASTLASRKMRSTT